MKLDNRQVATATSPKKQPFFINHAFRKLWLGQTISALGSHITSTGLSLAAILLLGATPLQMGLLAALDAVPVLLIGLLAGVWVDRLPRRPILIFADIGRAIILFSIPLAALLGLLRIEQLYIVTVLVGTLTVFFEVAHQAFLPMLVLREDIVASNSKLGTSSALAEIAGPALTGVLVQTITIPLAILFDGLSFLTSVLCIGLIPSQKHQPISIEKRQTMWRDIREGVATLFSNPLLRAMTMYSATWTFFGGAFATLYGIYIVRVLGVTPALYGVLVTLGGVGAFLGALVTAKIARRFGLGVTLLGSTLLHGVLSLLTPLAFGPASVIIGMLALGQLVGDFGLVIYSINEVSLRQTLAPERLLGRVNASIHFLMGGVGPIGAIVAGVLGEMIGIRLTLLFGAIGMLLSTIWLFFSPLLHFDREGYLNKTASIRTNGCQS